MKRLRERRWFVLERPRRDTNGGSETEVTVTSRLPSKYRKKQGDREETEKRRVYKEKAASFGGAIRGSVMMMFIYICLYINRDNHP